MFTTTFHTSLDSIPNLDALLELMRHQLPDDGHIHTVVDIRASLANALRPGSPARLILLCEKAHPAAPVGFAYFNIGSGLESGGDYIWLNEIHVSEKYRGQGGGRKLVEALGRWARLNRMKGLYGVCGTKNPEAQAFYHTLGFSIEKVCWISKSVEER